MDDREIIVLLEARQESALAEIEKKYGALCLSVARNVLGNEADAEECVNDALLAVWNKIPPEEPRSLRAYVLRIVRNLALDRFDYNTAARRNGNADVILDELAEILPDADAAVPFADEGSVGASIGRFLDGENERTRRVFVRRYWFCDPTKEIAARYGMSESGVKSMLSRTRKRLAAFLKKEGYSI